MTTHPSLSPDELRQGLSPEQLAALYLGTTMLYRWARERNKSNTHAATKAEDRAGLAYNSAVEALLYLPQHNPAKAQAVQAALSVLPADQRGGMTEALRASLEAVDSDEPHSVRFEAD